MTEFSSSSSSSARTTTNNLWMDLAWLCKTYKNLFLRIHLFLRIQFVLKAFDDFKNKQKCVWSYDFWYAKVCIFLNCIQYTIHQDKTHILKKIPSNKINGTKNVLFFISRGLSHQFYFDQYAIPKWAEVQGSSL